MTFLKLLISVLGLCISVSGHQIYPAQIMEKDNTTFIILTMKRPDDGQKLFCKGNYIGRSAHGVIKSENISCPVVWSDFQVGKHHFRAELIKTMGRIEGVTFTVEFKLPQEEIDCSNYFNGTLYGRKNTIVNCGCRLKDRGFPIATARWRNNSMTISDAKDGGVATLSLKIEDDMNDTMYKCEGVSRLGITDHTIRDIRALSQNYPSITTESDHQVKCDGIYPHMKITLSCNNHEPQINQQLATLEVSAETLDTHEILRCSCTAMLANGLSFNSAQVIEIFDMTERDTKVEDEKEDLDDDEEDDETEEEKAQLPLVVFGINGESESLNITEGLNVSIDCKIESKNEKFKRDYTLSIQRDGKELSIGGDYSGYELLSTMEASCKDSGEYTCTATDKNDKSSNKTVDVFVECVPVLEMPENNSNPIFAVNGTVRVEVDIAGYPEPNGYELLKDDEREKRAPEENVTVPRYTSKYVRISPGHGRTRLIMVGLKSKNAGRYVYVIRNGIGELKYKFRVSFKEEPVLERKDLGINIGAVVGAVIAATVVIIVLFVVYIVVKKKEWLLASDDEDTMNVTKVEIHQFPPTPTADEKPVLDKDEIKEKTEEGTKDAV